MIEKEKDLEIESLKLEITFLKSKIDYLEDLLIDEGIDYLDDDFS